MIRGNQVIGLSFQARQKGNGKLGGLQVMIGPVSRSEFLRIIRHIGHKLIKSRIIQGGTYLYITSSVPGNGEKFLSFSNLS